MKTTSLVAMGLAAALAAAAAPAARAGDGTDECPPEELGTEK